VHLADGADRLVEVALGPPAGLVPDLAGPWGYAMAELVRADRVSSPIASC
jgi:hypothetical protein